MVEVKWTDFAIQNLNEIGDYIEKKSYTSYASRVVSNEDGRDAQGVVHHEDRR